MNDKPNAIDFVKVIRSKDDKPQIILEGNYLFENSDLNLLPGTTLMAMVYDDMIVIKNVPLD